jgi:hypothetical protein
MRRTESFLFQIPEDQYLQLLAEHPGIFNHTSLAVSGKKHRNKDFNPG